MTASPAVTTPSSVLRLLLLSSTALPIGAYCYSQGVESAIETGLIQDEASTLAFLSDVLALMLQRYELPMLAQMMRAADDQATFMALAQRYAASRESRELLAETRQLAFSLNAWVTGVLDQPVLVDKQYGFLPVYARLTAQLGLPVAECLSAYAFTVLENQVLAVVKTVPLGQMSGQRVLWALQTQIEATVQQVLQHDHLLSNSLPSLAMLSMGHERQYSRLFRS